MLMKWSRPGAASLNTAAGAGGYSPRTLSKKQLELKQLQQDKKTTASELRDCDDQLEQIELEKARLEEAVDDDQDITEALDELSGQLSSTKKEKLAQLQLVEAYAHWSPPHSSALTTDICVNAALKGPSRPTWASRLRRAAKQRLAVATLAVAVAVA